MARFEEMIEALRARVNRVRGLASTADHHALGHAIADVFDHLLAMVEGPPAPPDPPEPWTAQADLEAAPPPPPPDPPAQE